MAKARLRAPLTVSGGAIAAHGHGKGWTAACHLPDQVPSVSVGEANVGDKNIVALGNFLERFSLGPSSSNGMSNVLKVETERIQCIRVVFDNENS